MALWHWLVGGAAAYYFVIKPKLAAASPTQAAAATTAAAGTAAITAAAAVTPAQIDSWKRRFVDATLNKFNIADVAIAFDQTTLKWNISVGGVPGFASFVDDADLNRQIALMGTQAGMQGW